MVPMAAVAVSFETRDGLFVELVLKVTDGVGAADAALNDIVERVENYVNEQELRAKLDEELFG